MDLYHLNGYIVNHKNGPIGGHDSYPWHAAAKPAADCFTIRRCAGLSGLNKDGADTGLQKQRVLPFIPNSRHNGLTNRDIHKFTGGILNATRIINYVPTIRWLLIARHSNSFLRKKSNQQLPATPYIQTNTSLPAMKSAKKRGIRRNQLLQ